MAGKSVSMCKSKDHWQTIYETKDSREVSWYQARPKMSLGLIEKSGIKWDDPVLDVGGGASTLVDYLLAAGFKNLTVLDISRAALEAAKKRLGEKADQVKWMEGDITKVELSPASFALWHDRALLHFLTEARDQKKYVEVLRLCLCPGGHVILSTFSLDGPARCSGLEVKRYDEKMLSRVLGDEFRLIESLYETHSTPFGTAQKFICTYFRRT